LEEYAVKNIVLVCGVLALSSPAFAESNFDWSGPYAGLQAGFHNSTLSLDEIALIGPVSDLDSSTAMSGGADMGYSFQSGGFVYGLEVDANFITGSKLDLAAKDTYHAEPNWYGTARARVGFSTDDVLLYGTGGLAFGDVNVNQISTNSKVGSSFQLGWVAGVGMEVAMSQQLSFKAELLHVDLGKVSHLDSIGGANGLSYQDNIARIGINFHF
jgi:outer membrane immunogenic protein